MGLLWASVIMLQALVTAALAERRGQSGLLWFVLGLLFPFLSLVVAALLRSPHDTTPVISSVADAARSSAVARALHRSPSASADAVSSLAGVNPHETRRQLSALQDLGLAERDAGGRWSLTDLGVRHLEGARRA